VNKESELWHFVRERLSRDDNVMLLVVAESSGSSPGRQGYKMAVGADGTLVGSIGGGVMEVSLVNQSREILSEPGAIATGLPFSLLKLQEHRKNATNPSGMICSGRQTVIFKLLTPGDADAAFRAVESLSNNERLILTFTPESLSIGPPEGGTQSGESSHFEFTKISDVGFVYRERLGPKNDLYIVGGGHCALALSELMSKMDFRIHIFDDRPELNTIDKNDFADEISVIDSYDVIADHVPSSPSAYVVVMTLGYRSDAEVIRRLAEKSFKYFGVLGSKAKMATLMKELNAEGLPAERLARIHTPIGLPINSRTPEEIAVSIAAQIIQIKNSNSDPAPP
jgi:xanthine dehydrogenase accessory factor